MIAVLAALVLQETPDLYKDVYAAGRKGLEVLQVRVAEIQGNPDLEDLALLALERSDVSEGHPAFKGLLAAVLARPPASTRSAALQAMALARLDPHRYQARIADCVQLILDHQAADGLWGPGAPVEPLDHPLPRPVPRPPGIPLKQRVLTTLRLEPRAKGPDAGDAANAAWAARGLEAGADAKIVVPKELLDRAIAAWRKDERPAGAAALALPTLLSLSRREARKDADVLKAVARLEEAPFPTTPRDLFPLRSAMVVLNRDRLGGRDWFREGGNALLKTQRPDGVWDDLETTAWAVLFIGVPPPLLPQPR